MITQHSKIGPLVGGALLIGLGLMTLLGQLFHNFHFWAYAWPLMVIGFGGLFFVGMFAGGKSVAGLAIPGSIITVNGLMLLIQNLTGYWSSWSYSWTVTLASVGLGIFILGAYQGNERRVRLGLLLAELVRSESLNAQQQQIRKAIEEIAQSYERPAEVIQWYLGNRERLADIEAAVMEDNVVDWVLSRARTVETTVQFDELMGNAGK